MNLKVSDEIAQWSLQLPFWEQYGLDKILCGNEFTQEDYAFGLKMLLQDIKIVEIKEARPVLENLHALTSSRAHIAQQITLTKMSNTNGINALVNGQTIEFSQKLTTLYGDNGAGKSGYARVLTQCSSQSTVKVLPNVSMPHDVNTPRSVQLEVIIDGTVQTLTHDLDNPTILLAGFSSFEGTMAIVSMSKQNEISVIPQGLGMLTKLVLYVDTIKQYLNEYINNHNLQPAFVAQCKGESEIKSFLANLGSNTDIDILNQYANLTSHDEEEFKKNELEISRLHTINKSHELDKIQQQIQLLVTLDEKLQPLIITLEDKLLHEVLSLHDELVKQEQLRDEIKLDSAKTTTQNTDSDIWVRFIQLAKELSAQTVNGNMYPQEGDTCLLCQQPLGTKEVSLFQKLWHILEDSSVTNIKRISANIATKINEIQQVVTDIYDADSVQRRELSFLDNDVSELVTMQIGILNDRKAYLLAVLSDTKINEAAPGYSNLVGNRIMLVVDSLQKKYDAIQAENVEEKLQTLIQEQINYQHRVVVRDNLHEIKTHIQSMQKVEKLRSISFNTRPITQKYEELFDTLVTKQYVESFKENLKQLGCNLAVDVRTRSQKGLMYKQLVLTYSSSTTSPIELVLSEGERRAIAIADFLALSTIPDNASGIIFDDPVTSLDHNWKEKIAKRLAHESANRQVIIFTHDLVFLSMVKLHAPKESYYHWISREGLSDQQPGFVSLNDSPALEEEYKSPTKAAEWHKKSLNQSLSKSEKLHCLTSGFSALRSTYEAFVIFELFGEVVRRFQRRTSIERLKNAYLDKDISEFVIEKVAKFSGYIEAHLHADQLSNIFITPEMLRDEIDAYEALRKRLKELKKQNN